MAAKITNPKIGAELVEELQDEAAYRNCKAFSATHSFLRKVLYFAHDQEYARIPAKQIKEGFETYGINYKVCLDVLVSHKLLEIDRHYIKGIKSRGYRLTEKGAKLMCAGQMHYLKKLFADRDLQRKLQKQQSYHRTKGTTYSHPILQYIHDGLMGYTFDEAAVNHIEKSDWGYLTRLKAMMSLTDFAERDFVKLKYNDADTRCWNEFAGMKSELRRYFSLGDLHYQYVIDIRSCHPLFLAHYLLKRSQPMGKPMHPITPFDPADKNFAKNFPSVKLERERSERLTNTPSTTINPQPTTTLISSNSTTSSSTTNSILHYDGGISDIEVELKRWNELFSDPDTDPKTVLIRDLGYTREQSKAALNQTINGGKRYGRFIKWFKEQFPRLFAIWNRTDKAKVGVGISTWYETVLMQDMGLYALAGTLGLHLTYEFDGCGVMCRNDDKEILAKIQQLIAFIQARSEHRWGIRPVVVVKTATGETVDMSNQCRSAERISRGSC